MTNNTTIEVAGNGLRLGLFVGDFDRPWLEVPYPIQDILIESQGDIDKLKRYYVHVSDIDKSESCIAQQYAFHVAASSVSSPRQYAAQARLAFRMGLPMNRLKASMESIRKNIIYKPS